MTAGPVRRGRRGCAADESRLAQGLAANPRLRDAPRSLILPLREPETAVSEYAVSSRPTTEEVSPCGALAFAALLMCVVALATTGTFSLQQQDAAYAASSSPTPGLGIIRFGNSYATGSDYGRYGYVIAGPGDAAVAGALPGKSLIYQSGVDVTTGWSSGVPYPHRTGERLAFQGRERQIPSEWVWRIYRRRWRCDLSGSMGQKRHVPPLPQRERRSLYRQCARGYRALGGRKVSCESILRRFRGRMRW